jgi:antirestriction protein ArdC
MPRNQKKNSKGPSMADVRQDVTDRILAALDQGVVPWHKPWRAGDALPMNVREAFREDQSKRKPYRGINVLLLSLESMLKGYSSPYWLTYNAAEKIAYRNWCRQNDEPIAWADAEATKINRNAPSFKAFKAAKGGGVREGEKSTRIYLFRAIPIEDKDTGETKHIPYARSFAVFNVEQCDNLCLPVVETEGEPFDPCDEAERILRDYDERDAPPVSWGGSRAFYVPSQDRIQVPERETFDTPADYYFTLFHEHAHGTGATVRLNRPGIAKYDPDNNDDEPVAAINLAA